ncbi:MAG: SPW repeat protein [Acidobacteriota bacterium]
MAEFDNSAGMWARWINIIAGAWLFVSAFVWPHTMSMQTNTWIVGGLIFVAAIIAVFAPTVRFANTVLAIWLFFSTFFIVHTNTGTVWNNVIVAIVVFVLSLTPSSAMSYGGRRPVGAT